MIKGRGVRRHVLLLDLIKKPFNQVATLPMNNRSTLKQNYSMAMGEKTFDFLQRIELCQNNRQLKSYIFSGQVLDSFSPVDLSSIALKLMSSLKIREQRCGILLSIALKANKQELKELIIQKSGIERMSGYLIASHAHLLFGDDELVDMLGVNKLTPHIRAILVKQISKKRKHLIKTLLDNCWDSFTQQHLLTLVLNLRSIPITQSAEYYSRMRLESSDEERIAKKHPEAYLEYIYNKIQKGECTLDDIYYDMMESKGQILYKLLVRLGNPGSNSINVECIKYIGEYEAFQLLDKCEQLIAHPIEITAIRKACGDQVAAKILAILIKKNSLKQLFQYQNTKYEHVDVAMWRRLWNIVFTEYAISQDQVIQLLDSTDYLNLNIFPLSIGERVSQLEMDKNKKNMRVTTYTMLKYLQFQDLNQDENYNSFLSYCNSNDLDERIMALSILLEASVYQKKRTTQVLEFIRSKIEGNFKHCGCLFDQDIDIYLKIFENNEHANSFQKCLDLCFKAQSQETSNIYQVVLQYTHNKEAIDFICKTLQKPNFKRIVTMINLQTIPLSIKNRLIETDIPYYEKLSFWEKPYLGFLKGKPELLKQFVECYLKNDKVIPLTFIDFFPERNILDLLNEIPEQEYYTLFLSPKFKRKLEENLHSDELIEFIYKKDPKFILNAHSYFPNSHRQKLLKLILNHVKNYLTELSQTTDIANHDWNLIVNTLIKKLAKQMTEVDEVDEFNKILNKEFAELVNIHGGGRDLTSLRARMLFISKYFPFPSLAFPKIIENFKVRHMHLVLLDVSKYFEPSEFVEGTCKYFIDNLEDLDTGLEMFGNILYCVTEFIVFSPTHDVTKVVIDFTDKIWRKCNGDLERLLAVHNFAINLIYLTNDMSILNRLEPILKEAIKGDPKLVTQQIRSLQSPTSVETRLNTDILVKLFNINMSIITENCDEKVLQDLVTMLNVNHLPIECKQNLVRLLFNHIFTNEHQYHLQRYVDQFIEMDWNFLSDEFNIVLSKVSNNLKVLPPTQILKILLEIVQVFKNIYPELTSTNRKILLEKVIEPLRLQIRKDILPVTWVRLLDIFIIETNWDDENSIIEHYIKPLAQLGLQVTDPMQRQLVYYDWCVLCKIPKNVIMAQTRNDSTRSISNIILEATRIVIENTSGSYGIEEQIIATGLLKDVAWGKPELLNATKEKALLLKNHTITHILSSQTI